MNEPPHSLPPESPAREPAGAAPGDAPEATPGSTSGEAQTPPGPPTDGPAPGVPDELIQALRSLSQDVRLSLLIALARSGPVCVTELSATQVREACTISRHLTNMTEAGLVRFRQQGQQRFYSLDRARLRTLLDELGDLLGV